MPMVVLARSKVEPPHELNTLRGLALLWGAAHDATTAFLSGVRWIRA